MHLVGRRIARQFWSSLAIVSTLAMGIGATTGVHAAFTSAWLTGAPGVPDPESVVYVYFRPPSGRGSAFGTRLAVPGLREAVPEIEHLAYWLSDTAAVQAPVASPPTVENLEFVSAGYFAALGVRAKVGRLLSDDDAETGTVQHVVISEALWRSRFGGDRHALGETIDIAGHPFTVIGVADKFRGRTRLAAIDLWLPIGVKRLVTGRDGGLSQLVGRIRAGILPTRVQAQLRAAYAREVEQRPGRYAAFIPFVQPAYGRGPRQGLSLYRLLMASTLLLLVLACANAANMLIARAGVRSQDTAIRLALGAGRGTIIREGLTEAAALSVLAGGCGIGVAVVVTRLLGIGSAIDHPILDARILVTCLAVTLATTVLFGLMPAVVAARRDIRTLLDHGGPTISPPHRHLRHGLVVAGIVLAVVLVSSAGLLNESLRNLLAVDLGMQLDGVIELTLEPDLLGYDDARSTRVRAEIVTALQSAGFPAVALAAPGPLVRANAAVNVQGVGDRTARRIVVDDRSVSPDYFRALSLAALTGRTFDESEYPYRGAGAMPVVLSQSLALEIFGTSGAVGRRFQLERPGGMASAVVVGVVGDTRSSAVRGEPRLAIYHTGRASLRRWAILVQSPGPARAIERVREVVHQVAPRLPITRIERLEDQVDVALAEDRTLAQLSGLFGVLAAVLAVAGVGALVWQLTVQRRRDFATRLAIGASRTRIVRDVLGGAAMLWTVGLVAGLGVYWLLSSWLASFLFGVAALNAVAIARPVGVLFLATCLAALLPAMRATRIDPAATLREK